MNRPVHDINVSTEPARKAPVTTQSMWQIVLADYEREEILLHAARENPETATLSTIAARERQLRLRLAVYNAINFLITNRDDINAVIAKKRGSAVGGSNGQKKTAGSQGERDAQDHVQV